MKIKDMANEQPIENLEKQMESLCLFVQMYINTLASSDLHRDKKCKTRGPITAILRPFLFFCSFTDGYDSKYRPVNSICQGFKMCASFISDRDASLMSSTISEEEPPLLFHLMKYDMEREAD
ncbi:hypothetical protein MANES_11G056150v8 [Manihot esculenta]|uniref:Uncharacterized protein n=1 Tax=Manihot esculenta TaxID=3983 RepID=A0ACB7GY76_MANES|nr:hypothetical protein MANES_11G056150v8 [Manihot esculenta]